MLDERKSAILRAIVNQYISTAEPVGSTHVAKYDPGVEVSSATIRSEMAQLEREGYLIQPHTSAGRIPSDKGYRYFVDHLSTPGRLGPTQRQEVKEFFSTSHFAIETMLHDTSKLLATLTSQVGVVIGAVPGATTVVGAQLVKLSPKSGVLVFILSSGDVERIEIEIPDGADEILIQETSAYFQKCLVGAKWGSACEKLDEITEPQLEGVIRNCQSALREAQDRSKINPSSNHVFVDGASHITDAFGAVDTVRNILSILEQQYLVVTLLKDILDRGTSVSIGSEHGEARLADCSIVVAPYSKDGEPVGTIGILGPTRMKYSEALATVAIVGNQLTDRLSETN